MKAHAISLILATLIVAPASSGQGTRYVYSGRIAIRSSNADGLTVSFPDVCKTPGAAGPSVPYPNVDISRSDFGKGSKPVKAGGRFQVAEARILANRVNRTVYRVQLVDKSGKIVKLSKSQIIEFADGTFCGVCIDKNGAVTALLKLAPARDR